MPVHKKIKTFLFPQSLADAMVFAKTAFSALKRHHETLLSFFVTRFDFRFLRTSTPKCAEKQKQFCFFFTFDIWAAAQDGIRKRAHKHHIHYVTYLSVCCVFNKFSIIFLHVQLNENWYLHVVASPARIGTKGFVCCWSLCGHMGTSCSVTPCFPKVVGC